MGGITVWYTFTLKCTPTSVKYQCSDAAQYLAFFLVQLYLNVSQLGPEIFVGCLQGRDERFGLLTLGTPFLGHRG